MSSSRKPPKRTFTIDEANARLPLIKAIVTDLVAAANESIGRQERLEILGRRNTGKTLLSYADEVAEIKAELERDAERIKGYLVELDALGIECKGILEGLIDFPAEIDGRPVYLCWKLGEPEVAFWHECDAGFLGRQPLEAELSSSHSDGAGESFDES